MKRKEDRAAIGRAAAQIMVEEIDRYTRLTKDELTKAVSVRSGSNAEDGMISDILGELLENGKIGYDRRREEYVSNRIRFLYSSPQSEKK